MHFTRFWFEYLRSTIALHRRPVCRIMLFSLVLKSFPQWLKFSRLFRQEKILYPPKRWDCLLQINKGRFFCLTKVQTQSANFSCFVKSFIVGFHRKERKLGLNHGLNLVHGPKTQTWIKIVIQNETQTSTFDFWFGCRLKRKIFFLLIWFKIFENKKPNVLHVFDFSKIQTET